MRKVFLIALFTGMALSGVGTAHGLSRTAYEIFLSSIDSLLTGKAERWLYSQTDNDRAVYTRNPNCWARSIPDITCAPVYNTHSKRTSFYGTLISPRHILTASHASLPVGTEVRWVSMKNSTIARTVVNYLVDAEKAPQHSSVAKIGEQ